MQQLMIPAKINVGFQKREDTYTKKLAYVIYYDQKGVLRKEKSWNTWRDDKIAPEQYDNVPTEGFVLNKGVGGQRHSYGWNARNEYIRVYDPRNFEFEISVANLLFILKETDCSRGKGLEGKFVYAWDGTELVLLPAESEDCKNSFKYTALQTQGVKFKDLIAGASYLTKKQQTLVYLGKFDHYDMGGYNSRKKLCSYAYPKTQVASKSIVFWDGKQFQYLNDVKTLANLNSDVVAANYAELVDNYYKSRYGSKIVSVFAKKSKKKRADVWYVETPSGWQQYTSNYGYQQKTYVEYIVKNDFTTFVDDKILVTRNDSNYYDNRVYSPWYREKYKKENGRELNESYYGHIHKKQNEWIEPTNLELFAQLESGSVFRLEGGQLLDLKPKKETDDGEEDYDGD